ncbi:hypothetical protein [Winogradskya humida]|uniref:Uncharacterized protein n=1 Tax=Winogradskya humida TaxID=113566 RepID=A0ABQ4A3S5_9ACTN|nr:hypothetical protein [Actinoplanes humidus]GIE25503.1 hypothetical protein Ahu01nite_086050 [Actinoplanes humidus]
MLDADPDALALALAAGLGFAARAGAGWWTTALGVVTDPSDKKGPFRISFTGIEVRVIT